MKSHLPLMTSIVLFIVSLTILLSIIQEKLLGTATYQALLFIISTSVDLENLSTAVGSLPAILSTFFMILPAIYLSVRLQFYEYFLIDEECGILESIKKSADISKGYVLELFILGVALSLMILISIIPMLLAIIFSAPLSMAAGLAGIVFSIPLSLMVISNVYLKLKKNH